MLRLHRLDGPEEQHEGEPPAGGGQPVGGFLHDPLAQVGGGQAGQVGRLPVGRGLHQVGEGGGEGLLTQLGPLDVVEEVHAADVALLAQARPQPPESSAVQQLHARGS